MHKILLAVKPRLICEAFKRRLNEQPNMRVVGQIDQDIDLLLAVRATEANVVIHTWDTDTMPAMYTHLLQEFPGLTFLGLLPGGEEAVLCEQRISVSPVQSGDFSDLISSLRTEAKMPAGVSVG